MEMSNEGQVNTANQKVLPQHISVMQKSLDDLHSMVSHAEEIAQRLMGTHPNPPTPASAPPGQKVDRPMSHPESLNALVQTFGNLRSRLVQALQHMEKFI